MAGYTPLFDSLTTGTLCGKWPDIGLWPVVLSMADRYGVVDVTHQYIATVTGLSHEEVVACMERFCQPDPRSRSQDNDGARLTLLEPHRDWGWKIVNHGKYTEKARLIHKNAREVEEGKNKARLAGRRATADDRRGPPETAPQSKTNSQSNNKFTPPTVEEVRAYCQERKNGINPQAFVDHYEANGWKRGKTPIKNWQACVRTWEQNNPKPASATPRLLTDA